MKSDRKKLIAVLTTISCLCTPSVVQAPALIPGDLGDFKLDEQENPAPKLKKMKLTPQTQCNPFLSPKRKKTMIR